MKENEQHKLRETKSQHTHVNYYRKKYKTHQIQNAICEKYGEIAHAYMILLSLSCNISISKFFSNRLRMENKSQYYPSLYYPSLYYPSLVTIH